MALRHYQVKGSTCTCPAHPSSLTVVSRLCISKHWLKPLTMCSAHVLSKRNAYVLPSHTSMSSIEQLVLIRIQHLNSCHHMQCSITHKWAGQDLGLIKVHLVDQVGQADPCQSIIRTLHNN